MLLLLQQAILKAPPTVTDSLKHSLAQLQHEVDSLKRLTQTSEIAKGFFSEIISLQLGIFLLLVGVAGWVSWGFLLDTIKKYTDHAYWEAKQLVDDHKKANDIVVSDLSTKTNRNNFDTCRSMYFIVTNQNKALMFGWALKAAVAAWSWKYDERKRTLNWLNNAKSSLPNIPYNEPYNMTNIGGIYEMFQELDKIEDKEIMEIVEVLKKGFHKALYTEP